MKTWLPVLAAALCAAIPAFAQAPAPAEAPIVLGTRHMLASAVLGEPREINIRLPAGYSDPKNTRRYPVLYVLDGGGDQDFPHIAGLAQHGEISGTFDEFITVGIATKRRIWELTFPTKDERYTTFYRANGQPVEFASGGGSEKFRSFISEEVIPFVEGRYRTSGRRAFMGESLAAFFVVDTLLRRPKLFTTTSRSARACGGTAKSSATAPGSCLPAKIIRTGGSTSPWPMRAGRCAGASTSSSPPSGPPRPAH